MANIECPICMDAIEGIVNCVTTECGHKFHCSCLMQNAAHNGFACPYCRNTMATEPERDDDDDESENWTDDDTDDEEDEEQYNDRALNAARWLFQRIEGEEVDEEEEEEPTPPPLSYLVEKMMESGITYEQLVKCALLEHNEYDYIFSDDEMQRVTNEVFMGMRTIISNYQPPNPETVLPIIRAPESDQLPMPMISRDNSMMMSADVKHIRFQEPISEILLD